MAGYTRQSLAQILNGEIVSAPPLNAEFNQILSAFNNSTGHKHDGTAAEGPPIDRIADLDQNNLIFVDTSANQINFYVESSAAAVGQISVQDGAIVPFTDDDVDLGSSSFEFKDLYIDGTAYIDSLISENVTITGGTITGVSNLSDIGNALPYSFSTTTTDSDPGSGVLRLNNATQNAATQIYIDDEEANAADVSAFIQLLSGGNNPSSVLGTITLRKEFNPDDFLQFKVTGVTNAAGYTKLTIDNTSFSSASPFSNSDNVVLDINLSGDKGDTGAAGGIAGGTLTGPIDADGNNITNIGALGVTGNATFQGGDQFQQTDLGTVTTAQAIAQADDSFVKATLGADVTFTFGLPTTGHGYSKIVKIVQDATGGRTPTIQLSGPVSVNWIGSEPSWGGRTSGQYNYVSVIVTPDGEIFASAFYGS